MSILDTGFLLPMGRFFRFMGGKFFLMKRLLPLVPPHRIYVEAFGGSAEFLFSKQPVEIEVYNDIDNSLVNLFEVVRSRLPEFQKKIKFLVYSRELKNRWEISPPPECPVEWAVRTFYCYMSAFAGKRGIGWAYGRVSKSEPMVFQRKIESLTKIHERLKKVYIEHRDFQTCIKTWDNPDTFFFLDPPYRNVSQANHIKMSDSDYHVLKNICETIQGKFLLTIGLDDFTKDLFTRKGWVTNVLSSFRASRGVTRTSKGPRGSYKHLLVRNYVKPRGQNIVKKR